MIQRIMNLEFFHPFLIFFLSVIYNIFIIITSILWCWVHPVPELASRAKGGGELNEKVIRTEGIKKKNARVIGSKEHQHKVIS
jgi:hypothetical protein